MIRFKHRLGGKTIHKTQGKWQGTTRLRPFILFQKEKEWRQIFNSP